ncbi:MAG: hypothetical protein ACREQN_18925 [Candidatus Binataceae bacterium]
MLLGLLLAFTFGMSILKHDNRRTMLAADSNAIGDFYTCATLLKEPLRTKLRTFIRDYAELRLQVTHEPLEREAFEEALQQFEQMQSQFTRLVAEALDEGAPIAVPLTNTLNGVTSSMPPGLPLSETACQRALYNCCSRPLSPRRCWSGVSRQYRAEQTPPAHFASSCS